jgi:hypothetical protein
MCTSAAARCSAIALGLLVGHEIGDYPVQTDWQALHKGAPGHNPAAVEPVPLAITWKANQWHVATYHLALAATVASTCAALGVRVSPRRALAALALSYGTHTVLDRRVLVHWLMDAKGTPRDLRHVRIGIDQAGHRLVLLACALIMAGPRTPR